MAYGRSKRFYDDQDHDTDHYRRRYFIDNPIEFLTMRVAVIRKFANAARKKAMQAGQHEDEEQFGVKPSRQIPVTGPDQVQSQQPGQGHRRIDDRFQKPAFHHLERLGLLRSNLGIAVIDKQPWQIEHPCHPRDDSDHVESLDPFVHWPSRSVLITVSLLERLPSFSVAPVMDRDLIEEISASDSFLK